MSYAAARAAAAYRSSQKLDQRPAAVLAAAHQELARTLTPAIAAYERRALDEMCRCNARAVQLLWALTMALRGRSPETDRLVQGYARLIDALNRLLYEPTAMKTLGEGLEWAKELTRMFHLQLDSRQSVGRHEMV
jgi:hypothetical protein